ncbi:hypothetical protein SAY87_029148 [Trapa incisa]|uniref:Uncharacterized protein n=1 Tax=Trapa incisa TaxID=236973 RepID=A0AAN7KXM7_9MYRT|nr:hypothetical protein SAY87_029148 [Trapa incisa]
MIPHCGEADHLTLRIATGHQDTVHDMAMDYYGKRISMASSDHNTKIIGVSTASSQDLATLNSQSSRTRLGDIMGSPQIRVYACFMLVRWPAPGALFRQGLLELVQKLCSGGCDNTVKLWKLSNGIWKLDCFPPLRMHTDWVRDVAWAPNLGLPKSTIASTSRDGKVIIWTLAKEGHKWEGRVLLLEAPVWRVPWSLTGRYHTEVGILHQTRPTLHPLFLK